MNSEIAWMKNRMNPMVSTMRNGPQDGCIKSLTWGESLAAQVPGAEDQVDDIIYPSMNLATGEPLFFAVDFDETEGTITGFAADPADADDEINSDAYYAIRLEDLTLNWSLVISTGEYAAILALLVDASTGMLPPGLMQSTAVAFEPPP